MTADLNPEPNLIEQINIASNNLNTTQFEELVSKLSPDQQKHHSIELEQYRKNCYEGRMFGLLADCEVTVRTGDIKRIVGMCAEIQSIESRLGYASSKDACNKYIQRTAAFALDRILLKANSSPAVETARTRDALVDDAERLVEEYKNYGVSLSDKQQDLITNSLQGSRSHEIKRLEREIVSLADTPQGENVIAKISGALSRINKYRNEAALVQTEEERSNFYSSWVQKVETHLIETARKVAHSTGQGSEFNTALSNLQKLYSCIGVTPNDTVVRELTGAALEKTIDETFNSAKTAADKGDIKEFDALEKTLLELAQSGDKPIRDTENLFSLSRTNAINACLVKARDFINQSKLNNAESELALIGTICEAAGTRYTLEGSLQEQQTTTYQSIGNKRIEVVVSGNASNYVTLGRTSSAAEIKNTFDRIQAEIDTLCEKYACSLSDTNRKALDEAYLGAVQARINCDALGMQSLITKPDRFFEALTEIQGLIASHPGVTTPTFITQFLDALGAYQQSQEAE
jgi:hypothetical protein